MTDQEQHIIQEFTLSVRRFTNQQQIVVRTMNDFADELDAQFKDVNIAKATFSAMGVVGGGASLAGVVFAPVTVGASLLFTVVGLAFTAAGVAGDLGTSLVDHVMKRSKVKKATAAIDEDNNAYSEFRNIVKKLERERHDLLQEIIETVKSSPNKATELVKAGIAFRDAYKLIAGSKIATAIGKDIIAGGKAIASKMATTIKSMDLSSTTVKSAVEFVTEGGIKNAAKYAGPAVVIACNFTSLVSRSIDAHKNKPCEVASQLRAIAKALEEQSWEVHGVIAFETMN